MSRVEGQLAALTAINQIGHDFFKCKDNRSAAMYICVQTQKIIPFKRSTVWVGKKVIAVTGQSEISKSSQFQQSVKNSIQLIKDREKITIIPGVMPDTLILYVPIICQSTGIIWQWLIEMEKPEKFQAAAELLSKHFSEGLLHLYRKNSVNFLMRIFLSFPVLLFITFVIACIFVKIPEKVMAPVLVKPKTSIPVRSGLDALVLECAGDGKSVDKGDIIATLDVSQFEQKKNETLQKLKELEIKINEVFKQSLHDKKKLIELHILKTESDSLNLNIEYLKHKISQQYIKAPISGILRYPGDTTESIDTNKGKLFRRGETLGYIEDQSETIAEISLSQEDIHVIDQVKEVLIYYYKDPLEPVESNILEIAPNPEINELSRTFVYPVKATTKMENGATGVAHLRGKKVRLGYYLFKKIFFYLRGF